MMAKQFNSGNGVLLTDALVITGDEEASHFNPGAVYVRSGQIEAVGQMDELKARFGKVKQISMQNCLIAPGMVNAHIHSPMGFFRGLSHIQVRSDQSSTMIENLFYPAEQALSAELIEALSYSYLIDNLRCGVTCVADAYFFADGMAKACKRLGLRGFIGEHIADLGGAFDAGHDHWIKTRSWIENWSHGPLVQPMVYAHAADTVSTSLLRELGGYAQSANLPFHMHLSQSFGEYERVFQREGISPVEYAHRAGVLGPNSLLVHLVSAEAKDLKLLKDTGSHAVICPVSEMIYEKLPDLLALDQAGVPISLATDGPASNDGANLLAELRIFALLMRDRGVEATSYEASKLYKMATTNPARAYGVPELGKLSAHSPADLVCYDLDVTALPASQPYETLIYSLSSRQVKHVMIDGEWVIWERDFVGFSENDLKLAYCDAVAEIKKRSALP